MKEITLRTKNLKALEQFALSKTIEVSPFCIGDVKYRLSVPKNWTISFQHVKTLEWRMNFHFNRNHLCIRNFFYKKGDIELLEERNGVSRNFY